MDVLVAPGDYVLKLERVVDTATDEARANQELEVSIDANAESRSLTWLID